MTRPGVSIDDMRAADVPLVKELEAETGLSSWSAGEYEAEIGRSSSAAIVARVGEDIAGFALARLITISDNAGPEPEPAHEIEIHNLAVRSSFRRNGIAAALFLEILRRLPEAADASVFLEVREKNAGARGFYRAIGLAETGLRPNFYANPPDNAVLMSGKASDLAPNLILKSYLE